LLLDLRKALTSQVYTRIKERYYKFTLLKVSTLNEVEIALSEPDYLSSFIITHTDVKMCRRDGEMQLPSLHKDLMSILWHRLSPFNNDSFKSKLQCPPRLLVLGGDHAEVHVHTTFSSTVPPVNPDLKKMVKLYNGYFNVRFCTSAQDVLWELKMSTTKLRGITNML